ncbi:MAG: cob(I)yrinic acid a,c-diamide adenosyltransferase [Candidatus Calescibacterium sp.]|nr:cob(I)yrinic acid a,c-diamide adenosyltransferase [Candidatus Calescibacterium sp.]MDW8132231.1 cob(I)yrinic acid a,c-diamide adenosyltransferase [Candidatus Calescibacterium sp.]
MKIYTKIGDKGSTRLYSGETVPKNDPLVMAYGKIDTLVSFIGFSKSLISSIKRKNSRAKIKEIANELEKLQIICFKIMTDLAGTNIQNIERIEEKDIEYIESQIDKIWEELPQLKNFIIPGNDPYSASLHLARSICREVEPILLQANSKYNINPLILKIVNRISDLLFSISIKIDLLINKNLSIIKNNKKLEQ